LGRDQITSIYQLDNRGLSVCLGSDRGFWPTHALARAIAELSALLRSARAWHHPCLL